MGHVKFSSFSGFMKKSFDCIALELEYYKDNI